MRKILLTCFAAGLISNLAYANSVPCNGFEIKIKNNSSDNLIINKINMKGADIQPGSIQKLDAHNEQIFTVNNSVNNRDIKGKLEFHSISLPTKKVEIDFDLKNKTLICEHSDNNSGGDYPVKKARLPGHVTYKIGS